MRRFGALLFAVLLLPAFTVAETLDLHAEGTLDVDTLRNRIISEGLPAEVTFGDAPLALATRQQLMELFPDTRFSWTLDVFGQTCATDDTALDMGWHAVTDIDRFIGLLGCLPALEKVDMYRYRITQANMARLTQAFPNIRFGFTFRMQGYELRSDDTSFSSLKDGSPPYLTSRHAQVIAAYCKDLLALDLGHNRIDDLSFLYEMPQLKILILACNQITDITPLGSLKNLEYLEIFKNPVTDIAALNGLDKLIDLNVANLKITDVSPLMTLTNVERLWLPLNRGVPQEQLDMLRAALPDTLINVDASGSTEGGWREHVRYKVIHHIFNYGGYLPWDTSLFTPQEP